MQLLSHPKQVHRISVLGAVCATRVIFLRCRIKENIRISIVIKCIFSIFISIIKVNMSAQNLGAIGMFILTTGITVFTGNNQQVVMLQKTLMNVDYVVQRMKLVGHLNGPIIIAAGGRLENV